MRSCKLWWNWWSYNHEISHGFDSGSRYNADGNLVDWWTADDLKILSSYRCFSSTVQCIRAFTGTFVDGKFTLGENIGDLGGINAAYDGLQLYLKIQD
jgi:predicted metalloendopeptidase